ncbi:hypothetical protein [Lacticaseibacillus absianus]|uniref:hypothetical protein n=1 Tax=Lacticaseibacillus absianus TaxID=2729623 RepID=UPI0015CCAA04|nr:hypothetical protein [Lacticaseibacillus absianus]
MALIKLDSGDYINTEAVDVIKGGDSPYIGLRSNNSFDITAADRDRIVEAINKKSTTSVTVVAANAIAQELALDAQNARRRGNIL